MTCLIFISVFWTIWTLFVFSELSYNLTRLLDRMSSDSWLFHLFKTLIFHKTVQRHNTKYRVSTKKVPSFFLAITPSNLHQILKGRSVLKSACSEDFKTVLNFQFWPSRSWDIGVRTHQGSFSVFTFLCNFKSFFCVISTKNF